VILTRGDWLKLDEVQVGDETIGYNRATGQSEWTPITRVVRYSDVPLIRLYNSRWESITTPNHRWLNVSRITEPKQLIEGESCPLCSWPEPPAPREPLTACPECGWKPEAPSANGIQIHRARKHGIPRPPKIDRRVQRGATTKGGLRIHLAKAHGIGAEKQRSGYATQASWVTTETIRSRDRLLLAAPSVTPGVLPISDQEAAILGWVAGDGHVERHRDVPRGRKSPSMSIAQSKPEMVRKLRQVLKDVRHACYTDERPTRMGKAACGPRHQFRLAPEYAQDLLARAGHPKYDAVEQVLKMSTSQRAAWLQAVIDAEGTLDRDGKPMIYQGPGQIQEAIALALYLSGHRPRIGVVNRTNRPETWAPEGWVCGNIPVITGSFLHCEDAGRGEVWCVTTEIGSWTARHRDHIFLTGANTAAPGGLPEGLTSV
jgi:hypothetical protein